MSQNPSVVPSAVERAELESVVEALKKSPRLAHLLRYMGDKYFAGETDQLNEYNIATEVLGRSKTTFDAGQDAIARVETHRLRKRLKEFYESEGKDHSIQVNLPTGSYVPLFVRRSEEDPFPALPKASPKIESQVAAQGNRSRLGLFANRYGWKYVLISIVIAAVALGSYRYLGHREPLKSTPSKGNTANEASAPLGSDVSRSDVPDLPIRILAGYTGTPRTDSAGAVWTPDKYFSGGGGWRRAPGPIARTSDPFIFEQSRNGDFLYSIPLKPGLYELHLFFSTTLRSIESLASFTVTINGQSLLQGFDVNSDALGENIADERVFRDVSPDKDGFLRIGFTGEMGPPALNAIEVLAGIPHKQNPIRLIMQTTPFTDRSGKFWHPDNYFMHGRLSLMQRPVSSAYDPELFSGERYGHFTYAIPVDTRGRYTVVLHFAEFYFGPVAAGAGGNGSRVFRVMCNGETLLDDFDIFREAGSFREVTKTFRHLKPTAQGKLNLTFEPIANNATISGIEVLDESE